MGLPKSIALLRAAADAGESVTLSAERCAEIVEAIVVPEGRRRRWLKVREAAAIMGGNMLDAEGEPSRTLRGTALRWWQMQERGQEPPVKVSRTGPGDRAHWLFDEDGCWAYRRERGGGPRLAATGTDDAVGVTGVDESQARTIDYWVGKMKASFQ